MTKREDAHLLSGAYALDAVTAEEAALVEAAMRESEDLHSEVVGLSDTAVTLGMALPSQTPPPALRTRLLDAIETTPQLAAPPEVAADAEVPPASVAMPVGEHAVRRRRRRARPMALLAAAAAAVVLFGGGFFVQRTLLEPQSEYSAIQAASDYQQESHAVPGGGVATVSWSKSEHRTAIVLNGVSAPAGKVLQLWSIHGGTVTSAGLYENGEKYALLSGTPSAGESLAVSVEPDGGSAQPTTTPIVALKLSA
jgi:anti-sigma-K factor RskA